MEKTRPTIGSLVTWEGAVGLVVSLNEALEDPTDELEVLWPDGTRGWLYNDESVAVERLDFGLEEHTEAQEADHANVDASVRSLRFLLG